MSRTPRIALDPVVAFIANQPGLAWRLMTEHVDDGSGHCGGCAWQQAGRPTHPCTLRRYAVCAHDEERRRRDLPSPP